MPEFHPVDADAVILRLAKFLSGKHAPRSLCRAWGGTRLSGDTSASGYDHAVACNLALCGFDASEIVFLLLRKFRHGVAARDGANARTIRAARRSAAKATAYAEALRTDRSHRPRPTSRRTCKSFAEEQANRANSDAPLRRET